MSMYPKVVANLTAFRSQLEKLGEYLRLRFGTFNVRLIGLSHLEPIFQYI